MAKGGSRIEGTDVLSAEPPRFSDVEAAEIAARDFGFRGRASGLVSERDQNFLIDDGAGGHAVLKISNAAEQTAVIEMEIAAALHAKRVDPELPIALPWRVADSEKRATSGADAYHASAEADADARYRVRMYDYKPGEASADPLTLDHDALWEFGRVVARLGARSAASSIPRRGGCCSGTSSTPPASVPLPSRSPITGGGPWWAASSIASRSTSCRVGRYSALR
jgi:Ser/Thr protein kinase RdoA (MazF antagonist)